MYVGKETESMFRISNLLLGRYDLLDVGCAGLDHLFAPGFVLRHGICEIWNVFVLEIKAFMSKGSHMPDENLKQDPPVLRKCVKLLFIWFSKSLSKLSATGFDVVWKAPAFFCARGFLAGGLALSDPLKIPDRSSSSSSSTTFLFLPVPAPKAPLLALGFVSFFAAKGFAGPLLPDAAAPGMSLVNSPCMAWLKPASSSWLQDISFPLLSGPSCKCLPFKWPF